MIDLPDGTTFCPRIEYHRGLHRLAPDHPACWLCEGNHYQGSPVPAEISAVWRLGGWRAVIALDPAMKKAFFGRTRTPAYPP